VSLLVILTVRNTWFNLSIISAMNFTIPDYKWWQQYIFQTCHFRS